MYTKSNALSTGEYSWREAYQSYNIWWNGWVTAPSTTAGTAGATLAAQKNWWTNITQRILKKAAPWNHDVRNSNLHLHLFQLCRKGCGLACQLLQLIESRTRSRVTLGTYYVDLYEWIHWNSSSILLSCWERLAEEIVHMDHMPVYCLYILFRKCNSNREANKQDRLWQHSVKTPMTFCISNLKCEQDLKLIYQLLGQE